jgi:glutaredoxin
MKRTLFFLVLVSAFFSTAWSGSLYRWVDRDGQVHYSDQPPTDVDVEEKNLRSNVIQSSDMPYATKLAAKNYPVTLYVTDCGEPCNQAREHLSKRGVPYASKDPSKPEVTEELKKLTGTNQVPVLVVGSSAPVKGYEPAAWDAALDTAGYPRSAGFKSTVKPAESKAPSPAAEEAPAPEPTSSY